MMRVGKQCVNDILVGVLAYARSSFFVYREEGETRNSCRGAIPY